MFEAMKRDFGKYTIKSKSGFWFANNFDGMELVLDIDKPKFSKKGVCIIKDIGEFEIPEIDFQYIRLRIVNNEKFIITFKNKNIVNKIEQNTEYEFDTDSDTFSRIANYLKENNLIFYYNIKESYEFEKDDLKIELSKFNNLQNCYLEVELVGEEEEKLVKKLEFELGKFKIYNIKEEPRSYMELSKNENRVQFKNTRLSNYSKDAVKELDKILSGSKI